MRNFYIFQISEDIEKSLKNNPYELFHALELIYYRAGYPKFQYNLVKQLIEPLDTKKIDVTLFKAFKDNYFYTKYKNIHSMHDVYRKENTHLTIHKSYLNLQTDVLSPAFFTNLKKNRRLFFCDFENADYFWLDSFKEASFI